MTTFDVIKNMIIRAISIYNSYDIATFDCSTFCGFRVFPTGEDGVLSSCVLNRLFQLCSSIEAEYYVSVFDGRPCFTISFDK